MKNLKKLLNKLFPLPLQLSNIWLIVFILLGVIGFGDATYLTIKHFQNEPPACSILEGCKQVATSNYSVIWGIPIALMGLLYYLCLLFLAIIYFDTKNEFFIKLAILQTVLGFIFSLYLTFLQIFIIKATCIYCLLSATSSILLFMLSTGIFAKQFRRKI
jgi:uncharacterized membrane protein